MYCELCEFRDTSLPEFKGELGGVTCPIDLWPGGHGCNLLQGHDGDHMCVEKCNECGIARVCSRIAQDDEYFTDHDAWLERVRKEW